MDLHKASNFVTKALAEGRLTARDIAHLVAFFQEHAPNTWGSLSVDGMPGPATLRALRTATEILKVYPLPQLVDGRQPRITSGHKHVNPSRPQHDGCDLFYRWQPSDGPMRMGDGGATRGSNGEPGWFIPDGLCAIAAARGTVMGGASAPRLTETGWRVWIAHEDGVRTGYFHLRGSKLFAGQEVSEGTEVGEVGDNPVDKDAEHLHFETSPVDRYAPFNPEEWLEGAGYFVRA